MLKLLGILLILWELLAEHIKPIVQNRFGKVGLSIFSAVLFYNRLREKAEIRSMAKRVSALEEGRTWNGATRKSCVMGPMNLRRLYRLLLPGVGLGREGRRRMQINMVTIIIAILGAIKIVLQAFNLNIITDENINAIANGVSAVATIAGVFMSHRKVKEVQHPFEGVTIGGDSKPTNTIGNTK